MPSKFKPVKPNEIPNYFEGRRGRVTYPLIKEFLEARTPIVMLDREGLGGRDPNNMYQSLKQYVRQHNLPINIFKRQGEVYLERGDIVYGEDGQVVANPEYKGPEVDPSNHDKKNPNNARKVDSEELASRLEDL